MMIPDGHRPCPKCHPAQTLGVLTIKGPKNRETQKSLRIDVCRRCHGAWCDWGEVGELQELKKLLPAGVNIPGTTSGAQWQRDLEPGVCPSCHKHPTMSAILVGAFHVDRCGECLGLWFDGGELGPMLTDQGFDALLTALRAHPV